MTEVATLKLRIDSREAKTAAGDLDKLGTASKGAEKEAGSMTRTFQGLGRAIGAVALGLLSREVIQAADAYKNMNARLQLVTGSMSELVAAQQGVFDISQRTRVSLGQTTDLFTSLATSTQSLGVSQEDLLQVTESINQALIISGTSASSAQAALVQLGQGFASGTLRGEELNSVLEQAPRLAKALADGLGVPRDRLRELGQAGELTAEKVFKALQKSGKSLNDEFAKMPLTVEQATTQAGTSLSRLIGIIDKATGATSTFALAISGAALGLDTALNRFSENAIVRAQAEVDTLRQRLLIMMQSNSAEHPMVKLLQKQIDDATASLKVLKAEAANNQSGAETARLGRVGKTAPSGPDLSTISGIQARLKDLRDLRDGAKVGSDDFKRLTGEIKGFEEQLKKLNPTTRKVREQVAEVFTSYKELITQRAAGLLESSDVTQAKIYTDTLDELDKLFFSGALNVELYESALKKLTGATSSADAATSKFREEQQRLAELLDATESAGIKKQREDMQLLTKALQEYIDTNGVSGISQATYLEAVTARLGLVTEKTKEAKTFAEQLGLSFSSAFEDAAVSGSKARDVIKGLIQDIARLVIRKNATEPFANAVGKIDWGSLFSGLFGPTNGPATGADLSLFYSAKGNVFDNAPGLSAYSGQVVSKPTLFPFARGAGMMGEAGPEAILPLQRGTDGKLGVAGGGGGNVIVNVNNLGGTPMQVAGQSRSVGADGTLTIGVMVRAVEAGLADSVANRSGPLSRALESGYGIRPSMS